MIAAAVLTSLPDEDLEKLLAKPTKPKQLLVGFSGLGSKDLSRSMRPDATIQDTSVQNFFRNNEKGAPFTK